MMECPIDGAACVETARKNSQIHFRCPASGCGLEFSVHVSELARSAARKATTHSDAIGQIFADPSELEPAGRRAIIDRSCKIRPANGESRGLVTLGSQAHEFAAQGGGGVAQSFNPKDRTCESS